MNLRGLTLPQRNEALGTGGWSKASSQNLTGQVAFLIFFLHYYFTTQEVKMQSPAGLVPALTEILLVTATTEATFCTRGCSTDSPDVTAGNPSGCASQGQSGHPVCKP